MTLFTFNVQQYSNDYTNCSLVRSLNLSAVLLSVCVVCKINVVASIMNIYWKNMFTHRRLFDICIVNNAISNILHWRRL